MDKVFGLVQEVNLMTAIFIFVAYLFVDGLYAYYTLAVVNLKPYTSATVGAFMYLLLAVGIINYISNPVYLLPMFLGSWLGTFIVVKYRKSKK